LGFHFRAEWTFPVNLTAPQNFRLARIPAAAVDGAS
jgi:hypothetical protein